MEKMMPKFATNQRRALYVVEPKREYFVRLSNAVEAGGWIELQRTYREQGFWTVQKCIDPLVR
jgi:hypothetical protein